MSNRDNLIVTFSILATGGCFYLSHKSYQKTKSKEYTEFSREMSSFNSIGCAILGIGSSLVGLWVYLNPSKVVTQK